MAKYANASTTTTARRDGERPHILIIIEIVLAVLRHVDKGGLAERLIGFARFLGGDRRFQRLYVRFQRRFVVTAVQSVFESPLVRRFQITAAADFRARVFERRFAQFVQNRCGNLRAR